MLNTISGASFFLGRGGMESEKGWRWERILNILIGTIELNKYRWLLVGAKIS